MKLYKNLNAALSERSEVRAIKLSIKEKSLPQTLFDFPNLEEAYLEGDCEDFPATIKGWEKLRILTIKFEKNKTDLSAVFTLPSLENLKIIETPIKVFLLPLGKINAPLKFVTIKGCGLERLPEEMSMMDTLEELSLPHNRLFVLPFAFQDLKSLKRINLDNNKFVIFPKIIKKMPNLKHLSIDGNTFDDEELAKIQREFHIYPN